MARTESNSVAKYIGLGILLLGAAVSIYRTVGLLWPPRVEAMSDDEVRRAFEQSEAIDRANYEKMWQQPPPSP